MSDIPKARAALQALAETLPAPIAAQILDIIHDHLWRVSPVRKGRVKNNGVSPDVKRRIRELAATDPNLHLSEIGEIVGVNQGRVSEVLNGKR